MSILKHIIANQLKIFLETQSKRVSHQKQAFKEYKLEINYKQNQVKKFKMKIAYVLFVALFGFSMFRQNVFAQSNEDPEMIFSLAKEHFVKGEHSEDVLGHPHLGKGMAEVTLVDYNGDGSFQLYDVNRVMTIMKHELGHSLVWKHVENANDIMYPSFSTAYANCLS